MANEIVQVSSSTEIAPLSSKISVPQYHDDPQASIKEIGESALEAQLESKMERRSGKVGAVSKKQRYIMPTYWTKDTQDIFNAATPQQQKIWVKTLKIAEKYYQKRINDVRMAYAPVDALLRKIAPYARAIDNTGMPIEDYIESLINADRIATSNPTEYILRIMAACKITYEMLENNALNVYDKLTSEVQSAPLIAKIDQLQRSIEEVREQPAQLDAQPAYNEEDIVDYIVEFYNQVDSSGRPLYPNAANMYEEIGDILQSGETEDLDKAYRLALRSRKPNIPKNSFKQNVDFEDEQQPIVYNREIDNKKQYLRRLKDELERQYQNS